MQENTFIDIYEIYGYIKFIRTNENWPFAKTRGWVVWGATVAMSTSHGALMPHNHVLM